MRNIFKSAVLFVVMIFSFLAFKAYAQESAQKFENSVNKIPIAMATDNNYVYPTIVAMTSMLENKNDDTHLDFHIMISGQVSPENKDRMKILENLYRNCTVELIDMKDKFNTAYTSADRLTSAVYYRLCLPSLLPQYDKILYLDVDIIVRKDLWKLYSTEIGDNYIGAVKDFGQIRYETIPELSDYAKRLGVDDLNQCINSGVLVMNLKQLREDNMETVFNDFVAQIKERRLILNDQDVLSAKCYNRIKFLSPEYNAMQHFTFDYNTIPILIDCYDMQEWKKALVDPTIVHYTNVSKPWKTSKCKLYSLWNKYSKIAESKIYDIPILKNGIYTISSALNENKVLDIDGANKQNEGNLHLWRKNSSNAQKFKVTYKGEGFFEIEAICSGKVLDVKNAGKKAGTNVYQYEKNDTDAQKWYIKRAENGYYYIVSKCNGLYLDVNGAKTSDGTNIHVWEFNGSNAQKFKFLLQS